MQSTDTVPNEAWALMFGPIMSKKLIDRLPIRMFEDIDTRGKIMYHLKIKNAFTKIDKPNI
jgi:hypothetical protein